MKPLASILIVALLAVSGTCVALLMREKQSSSTSVAEAAKAKQEVIALKAEHEKLAKESKSLADELKNVKQQLTEAKAATEAAQAKIAAAASSSGGSNSRGSVPAGGGIAVVAPGKGSVKALSEMMKNPAMREMAKQQQIAMLDMQYGDLMSHFQLAPEEMSNFKQLLAERIGIDAEMGMKLMDDSLTPAQRQAMLKEVNDSKAANEQKIKTFLNNDDDFNSFKHWEDTKAERTQLAMGKATFTAAGVPLTPDQEQQLVDAMHVATMRPSDVPNMNRPENFDPGKFTQNDIDRQMQKVVRDQDEVYREAQKFLNPKQLEALATMQKQNRAMIEASFKMAGAMFSK